MYYRNDTNAVIEDNSFATCDCGLSRAVKFFDHKLMEDVVILTCDACHATAPNHLRFTDAEILREYGDSDGDGFYWFNGNIYEIDPKNNVREYYKENMQVYRIIAPNGEEVGYEHTKEEALKRARQMMGDDILNDTQCDYWVTWDE
jgi:hypothetical protein